MRRRLSIVMVLSAVVMGSAGGCQSREPGDGDGDDDDPATLQALLDDAPLTRLPPGSSGAAEPGDGARRSRSHIVLPSVAPAGVWNFDDCQPSRTNLGDASGQNNTAFRSIGVACTEGIDGSPAVAITEPEDLVYVPDQPSFTFGAGVTVAGWFKPDDTGGTRTLFRKRDNGTSSFALVLHGGKFKFVIGLAGGGAVAVTAKAKARIGEFQHVAATYDGITARLYLDGTEAKAVAVAGSIPPGPGPLVIGNDGSERRFDGAIDSALFATHALTGEEILALLCVAKPPDITKSSTFLFTPAGSPATIDISITNRNPAICAPVPYTLFVEGFDDHRIAFDPDPSSSVTTAPVPGGATAVLTVTATPATWVDPDTFFTFNITVDDPLFGVDLLTGAEVITTEPADCHINTSRELMITSTSVVDDPVRTAFDPGSTDPRNGVWTFKHLMENIAATPEDAPAMVQAMFDSFGTPQTINGFTVAARPGVKQLVLDHWPHLPGGALDLGRAPVRLQAIVNRFDLRDLSAGHAGQGRFVFAFNDPASPSSGPLEASLIFEYHLPATMPEQAAAWAAAFHALGALPLFSEDYNAALQAVTEQFVGRGAQPGAINGSAISSVRTNDFAFALAHHSGRWELRQFELSPAGQLAPVALERTPDASFSGSVALASYLVANQADILADRHTVPAELDGQPFQAGAVFNNFAWVAPGVDPELRHHFAINTCNGCHAGLETGANFFQIRPRSGMGSEAILSPFLIGTTVNDPVSNQPRTFGDLARRHADFKAAVCGAP